MSRIESRKPLMFNVSHEGSQAERLRGRSSSGRLAPINLIRTQVRIGKEENLFKNCTQTKMMEKYGHYLPEYWDIPILCMISSVHDRVLIPKKLTQRCYAAFNGEGRRQAKVPG